MAWFVRSFVPVVLWSSPQSRRARTACWLSSVADRVARVAPRRAQLRIALSALYECVCGRRDGTDVTRRATRGAARRAWPVGAPAFRVRIAASVRARPLTVRQSSRASCWQQRPVCVCAGRTKEKSRITKRPQPNTSTDTSASRHTHTPIYQRANGETHMKNKHARRLQRKTTTNASIRCSASSLNTPAGARPPDRPTARQFNFEFRAISR